MLVQIGPIHKPFIQKLDGCLMIGLGFILRKARVKKYRRVKGHRYGYEYFDHEEESQDE